MRVKIAPAPAGSTAELCGPNRVEPATNDHATRRHDVREHASSKIELEPEAIITRAWYGDPAHEFDANHGRDVTDLAALVVNNLVASNGVWGDPAVGVSKILIVESKLARKGTSAHPNATCTGILSGEMRDPQSEGGEMRDPQSEGGARGTTVSKWWNYCCPTVARKVWCVSFTCILLFVGIAAVIVFARLDGRAADDQPVESPAFNPFLYGLWVAGFVLALLCCCPPPWLRVRGTHRPGLGGDEYTRRDPIRRDPLALHNVI